MSKFPSIVNFEASFCVYLCKLAWKTQFHHLFLENTFSLCFYPQKNRQIGAYIFCIYPKHQKSWSVTDFSFSYHSCHIVWFCLIFCIIIDEESKWGWRKYFMTMTINMQIRYRCDVLVCPRKSSLFCIQHIILRLFDVFSTGKVLVWMRKFNLLLVFGAKRDGTKMKDFFCWW